MDVRLNAFKNSHADQIWLNVLVTNCGKLKAGSESIRHCSLEYFVVWCFNAFGLRFVYVKGFWLTAISCLSQKIVQISPPFAHILCRPLRRLTPLERAQNVCVFVTRWSGLCIYIASSWVRTYYNEGTFLRNRKQKQFRTNFFMNRFKRLRLCGKFWT